MMTVKTNTSHGFGGLPRCGEVEDVELCQVVIGERLACLLGWPVPRVAAPPSPTACSPPIGSAASCPLRTLRLSVLPATFSLSVDIQSDIQSW